MSSRNSSPSDASSAGAGSRAGSSIIARILLRFALAVGLALATLLLLAGSLSVLPEPSTLAVIRAESETTRFTVGNAQAATLPIGGFRIFGEGDFDEKCVSEAFGEGWALEPQLGVQVSYTVLAAGRLLVELRGFEDGRESAVLRGAGPDGRVLSRSAKFDLALRDDPECGERAAWRLPVWGPGEIGGEPVFRGDGPAATLLSGSLKMYGRATPYRFSLSDPFGAGAGRAAASKNDIYPSLSEFDFPPGSRVSTLEAQAETSRKTLSGFAIQEGRVLRVEASTESPEVYFYPPGAGKQPDRLRMSLLSRIGNDPNLGQIFQIIVWFVVVLPIAIELIRPLFARQGEDW